MAEFTNIELRAAREERKIPRWKLAGELGVSEDTLERWETGKQRPEPDDVGNIERILKIPGIWHKWMLSHYDSYRERYTDIPQIDNLTNLIVRMKYEITDVIKLIELTERDSLDGVIDSKETREKLKKEVSEAIAAMQQVHERVY